MGSFSAGDIGNDQIRSTNVLPYLRVNDAGAHNIDGSPASESYAHAIANLPTQIVNQSKQVIPIQGGLGRANHKTPKFVEGLVCAVRVLVLVIVGPNWLHHVARPNDCVKAA
jgi:hypothetical protein